MSCAYSRWRKAMSGKFGPLHENDPRPGRYRTRGTRKRRAAAVEVFVDVDGSLRPVRDGVPPYSGAPCPVGGSAGPDRGRTLSAVVGVPGMPGGDRGGGAQVQADRRADLAERFKELEKTADVISRRAPWRRLEVLEFATPILVDSCNDRAQSPPMEDIPPPGADERFCACSTSRLRRRDPDETAPVPNGRVNSARHER
jgi:hypothetical protein